jgi:phosphohistidine swiveling domain-containing protein
MLQQNYIGHRRDTGEEVAFPVVWTNAGDAERTWRWDAEHNPFPLTPLSQEFSRGMGSPSMAAESLGAAPAAPMAGVSANGYRYNEGRGAFGSRTPAYLETVAAMAPRVEELWDHGWRLEIEARGRDIAAFDYDSLTLSDLVKRLELMAEGVHENMVLMFRASHLVSFSRGELLEFCEAHIGKAAESFVTDLLQGTPSVSLESGAALWDVAQVLAQNADAFERLRRHPDFEGLASLLEIDGGGAFVTRFNDWLTKYGQRNGSFGELAEPTWFEDPRVAIGLVLQSVGAYDPRLSQKKAIRVRELLQREFEGRLRAPDIISRFRELLATAEPYLGVRESRDHATNMALTAIRLPALALGRRLVERDAIESPADVFFLRFSDLEAAALDPTSDLRALVAERRDLYEYWRNVAPPVTIGASAPREVDPRFVRGVAASAGVATGTARVIMTLADAHTLRAGDILVTRATTPAWTPLFGTAAAVVTEGGGVLSHCAILAREYGIPAVVGASGASVRIRDGATITVDGTKGRVIIEEQADRISGHDESAE